MKVSKKLFASEDGINGVDNEHYNIVLSTTKNNRFNIPVVVTYEIDKEARIKESDLKNILNKYLVSELTVDNVMNAVFGGGENE